MELRIGVGEARRPAYRSKGLEIQVRRGSVWITFSNDSRDYFLSAGERAALTGQGAVLQALGDGHCECEILQWQTTPSASFS
jgi:hypothetical protein